MKRSSVLVIVAFATIALFVGLVYGVLVVAHVSEPATVTVDGLTARRAWATAAVVVGLVSVVVAGLALRRSALRIGSGNARKWAKVALASGLVAAVNGLLNLAVATGGPGSGNGVVGGAGALVLGLIALAFGGLVLAGRPHAR